MDGGFLTSQAGGLAGLALPTAHNEAFKYTPLKALAARALPVGDAVARRRAIDRESLPLLPGTRGGRLVFLHGIWRQDLSDVSALPEGVVISAVAGPVAAEATDAFEALNRLHAQPLAITIAPGSRVDGPLELVFLGAPAESDLAWYARIGIELGAGASVGLVEHHVSIGDPGHVGNVFLSAVVGEGASLTHLRVADEGPRESRLATTEIKVAAGAVYEANVLALGGVLARHAVKVALAGAGAATSLRGATALGGRQHGETQVEVRHAVGDTSSNVLWRAAAAGRSRAVFRGRIVIEAGADGSAAALSNKNLLLSPHAEIDAKPVLEIEADEVQASHGSTVGRLDENALFYLRARGVPEAEARAMLTRAFCQVALDGVCDPTLVQYLADRLDAQLPSIGTGAFG
jgi:Fe-S cluster assembly protein SufD